jgi:NAD(P)-dependent dehydrogenase (short-subunit alcohol dehydrogenase family)
MSRLSGKIAVVTGAGRGIGRAIALRFAHEGALLAMCDLNLEQLETVAAEARQIGAPATLAARVDVAQRADVEAFITRASEELGTPNILVNNAGIFFNASLLDMTDEQWDKMMSINVKSVFLLTQALLKRWVAEDVRGSIVNLASISASIAFTNSAAYCASKAAVAAMTRVTALEYGPHGIRCNAMAPGIIDTSMLPDPEGAKVWSQKIPLRRLGQPEDVADLALYLASDESRYITGDTIYVDGGWMIE